MKQMFVYFFISIQFAAAAQAQEPTAVLDMQLNKNILQPGDSLLVNVEYRVNGVTATKLAPATLEMIVENEEGRRTRLRWPLINGQASGALYLPDSLPQGKYHILAGLQQRFFEVVGQVKNAGKNGTIQAMLLTRNGDWDQQEVDLAANGTFAIRNWLFDDNALLAFSASNNRRQALDIRISTQLDSSNSPLAVAGRVFYIGNPSLAVKETLEQPLTTPIAAFADKASLLPAVFVRTSVKTPAQQFSDEYVSGLFRGGDERTLSIMDDPTAIGSPNIFTYLQGRIAGLQIARAGFNSGAASWRGGPVNFFIDEMRVSAEQVGAIPITDIAIVKAFPPPFLGASGGGGAIAIYTRRGGEGSFLPANRQVFRVRGYTAGATVLNMDKGLL